MSKRRGGWERMKAANRKKSRVNEAWQSTPKLCTYFASKSNAPSTSDVMSTSKTIRSTTVTVADSEDQQRDNSWHHLIVEGADTDSAELLTESAQPDEPSIGSQQPPNQDYQAAYTAAETGATTTATSMFSNDPGFWEPISETMDQSLDRSFFVLYTADIGSTAHRHDLLSHFYADDSQLYLSCRQESIQATTLRLNSCISEISFEWMASNRLKLNQEETDILWCATKRRLLFLHHTPLLLSGAVINPSAGVNDLGSLSPMTYQWRCHVNLLVSQCFISASTHKELLSCSNAWWGEDTREQLCNITSWLL